MQNNNLHGLGQSQQTHGESLVGCLAAVREVPTKESKTHKCVSAADGPITQIVKEAYNPNAMDVCYG
jgi:hypothetical protein